MNSLIQRWNTVPSYRGTPFFFSSVAGCVHSFSPVASPTKFSTVFGASLLNSRTTIVPSVVSKVANSSWPVRASSIIPMVSPERVLRGFSQSLLRRGHRGRRFFLLELHALRRLVRDFDRL